MDLSLSQEEECKCQEIFEGCETLGNMKCAYNVLGKIADKLMDKRWERTLSAKFLKIRHNIFADSYMSDNELVVRGTDYCLREIGVDSDLSPDIYLGKIGDTHMFVEFFVTNNPEIALQNKKEKYSKFLENGVSVEYIYFDMRTMMCFSDSDSPFKKGYNLEIFESTMKRMIKLDRYLIYDSSELDIEKITPGKTYGLIDQNIFYSPIYSEYTNEEYIGSLGKILTDLNDYPDEEKCCICFDCKSRKFSIKQGTKDPIWMLKAVRDSSILRDIIVYENYSEVIEEKCSEGDENIFSEDGHFLKMGQFESRHGCLEKALSNKEIHLGLKNIEFDGLYLKKMTPETIIEEGSMFYEKWMTECQAISTIKLKMTTMLPLPNPDMIDSKFDKFKIMKRCSDWLKSALSMIDFDNLRDLPSLKDSGDLKEIDREIFERYAFIESCESKMRLMRREMMRVMGSNVMSYRIKLINDFFKEMIRREKKVDPDKFVNCQEFILKFSPSQLEKDYFKIHLEKIKAMRETRRKMKKKCTRDNMFTMDKKSYKIYNDEKKIFLKRRMKGDERMGLNGYSGELRFEDLEESFSEFWKYLLETGSGFEDWFEINISPESFPKTAAGDQCKDYYAFYRVCKEKIRKTRIYRIILWISNLCRSIWAISTYKTKKRNVVFDRFGTKGCLLFVASTGNIQKFKSSKAFRILIPINNEVEKFCGYENIPGCEVITTDDNKRYLLSHWSYLKVQHLKYFMELPGRWVQTITCIMSEYNIMNVDSDIYMYITYCMLNARRKNENLLHDLKYLTYNMFGLRGCYSELLEDKFEIPRDMLERYIEEKFLRNIEPFVKTLKHNELLSVTPVGSYPSYRLSHPLSNSEYGLDSFNLFVYSSYCFPKGIFTHETEQVINMQSILSIHDKAIGILGDSDDYYSVKEKTDRSFEEIFDCDLNYNSGVVSSVGLYCEHYICTRGMNADIRGIWANIINSDITEYANSHGLRENDLSDSKSWGKKGHDVMTALISRECDPDVAKNLEDIHPETIKDTSKCKWMIKSTKYRIKDYAKNHLIERVELNNANKVQWGGSREIYIMTIGAKNIQWSLEQMFAKLSRFVGNEFIHVPAAERFGKLYGGVKQKVSGIRYYLTLDCRKWAPLSNINKYLVFINSMGGILPPEFIEDFNYFFDIYYKKRLFFKESDVQSFLSRQSNRVYEKYFVRSGSAYYIQMPYSFMMGMFNYLSSILHAVSQKYFEENIIPLIEKEEKCKIKFVMYAHSDDSGGYVEISKSSDPENVLDKVLKEYEAFQKCLNHMFSLKKCTVGTSYFEITSYCFMKTDPMPVLSKFIYNHQINLTPVGYFSDVKSISSSVMEMIANGSTFRTCFIKYLILGNSYRKFCVGQCINDSDAKLSLDLGGFPLIHPFYLCVYKSLAEEKWLSEFGDGTVERNKILFSNVGMVDAWGVKRGLKVKMISMKPRDNDGRFKGYESLKEIPDEIIPSGHYACYMRKMSSKYYSDTMWYSMHDIDGSIIQSNMFNKGLSQMYNYMGRECGILEVIALSKKFIYSENSDCDAHKFPDYIEEINRNISINKNCSYEVSDVRPKPAEINTYYNSWWKNKTRETKIIALIKLCPWMAIMCSSPIEYMDCLESSGYVDLPDIMNTLTEEEPLMRFMMTTKSESRLMDRFDTISSWMFYNSYPGMRPKRLKRIEYKHNLPTNKYHPECMSSIMFEAVSSGRAKKESDLQLVEKNDDNSYTVTSLMVWLKGKVSNDPLHSIVIGNLASSWIDKIDFICLKNNQYSQYGRYWIGRTECVCRVSGRSYGLTVVNGAISEIRCREQYSYELIEKDMRIIDRFGFRYSSQISNYKTRKIMRITKTPDGFWRWMELAQGMPYISNIKYDPSVVTEKRLRYEKDENLTKLRAINSEWARFKLRYDEGKKSYRAYILHKKPCDRCLSSCKYSGQDMFIGEKTEYDINLDVAELYSRWRETETYSILYKEKIKFEYIFSEYASYMGQIGTYLSAAYIGSGRIGDHNFFKDYRGELSLESMSTHEFNPELILAIKSRLSKYVKFSEKSGKIVAKVNSEKIKETLTEYGAAAVSTALMLLPVERTVDYYNMMTYDNYWYNNAQVMPAFMSDSLRYIYSTIDRQKGMMAEKNKRFKDLLNEIVIYLGYSYQRMVKYSYMASIPVNLRLIALIRSFSDVGDPNNEEIDMRFYYDPDSIIGCINGWMRYILIYSNRREGMLTPDHKVGYKREYNGFLKKYRSMCINEFQITINIPSLTSFKTLDAPPYQMEAEDIPKKRVYPLYGCDFYNYNHEEDWFDPDSMTYDREESMISFNYNERMEYDFANESVFHEEGIRKRIRMCSEDDANNWVLIDRDNYIYELRRFKAANLVGVKNGKFSTSLGAVQSFIDLDLMNTVSQGFGNDDNLLKTMLDKLTDSEKEIIGYNDVISKSGKIYKVRMGIINSLFVKHAIFNSVFDEHNDLTPILERDSYDDITNQSNPLNDNMFNQIANAEMNKISPGIISRMETNHFRMTKSQFDQIKTIRLATRFLNKPLEYSFERIMASVVIVNTPDQFCSETSERMFNLLKSIGEQVNLLNDTLLPHPREGEYTIPHKMRIGV